MAISRLLVTTFLVSFLVLQLAQAHDHDHQQSKKAFGLTSYTGSSPKLDCGSSCDARCQLSSRPNLCKRACGTCCVRCSCVPTGTAGNYDECPCYGTITTHGGRRKCP
ncbi:unnamed protein product [Linum tenue]|uniref:Snakin-2 n=1 Tax=Linum tenue TaxID=586396 RepID=A0AAV0LN07_9ROSI|nr:unnamed protein product [Linum tenue]